MAYAIYQKRTARMTKCLRSKFDSLQLDAKRVMGLEPAKAGLNEKGSTCPYETLLLPLNHPQRKSDDRTNLYGAYLQPPEESSPAWNWATRLLALKYPVAEVWVDGLPLVVGLDELTMVVI